jgi:hypothetical protein
MIKILRNIIEIKKIQTMMMKLFKLLKMQNYCEINENLEILEIC